MNIVWYGQTCFKITVQKGKNGLVNLLIDPFEKEVGLKPPKSEADIILLTSPKSAPKTPFPKESFLISGPGEYDIKGIYIEGIAEANNLKGEKEPRNTIYTIESEEIKICHLGALRQKELNSQQLERIGDIDILMLPVGGGASLDASEAVKIMSQIEPRITLPAYYKLPNLKEKLESPEKFLKSLGIKSIEPLPKLSLKQKDISKEEAKVILLSA